MSLNPQIKKVQVGTKELRTVTIYPLSVADQFTMTELIGEVLEEVSKPDFSKKKDMEVVDYVVKTIKNNLKSILEFVLDPGEEIKFTELTNTQLVEIVDIIFNANYEEVIKNLKDLTKKAKALWTSKGSLPKSSGKQVTK